MGRLTIGSGSSLYQTTTLGLLLHLWEVGVQNQSFPNEYVNYRAVPSQEEASFLSSFAVPGICSDSAGARSCDSLHKEGKLSDKSIKFLRRNGKLRLPASVLVCLVRHFFV